MAAIDDRYLNSLTVTETVKVALLWLEYNLAMNALDSDRPLKLVKPMPVKINHTMTPEKFAEEMAAIAKGGADIEADHSNADGLLCKVLRQLGYGEGVTVFENMDKWYA